MKIVEGDILSFKMGIIGHQVNCRLVMGAGLAGQIKNMYPRVFDEYKNVMGKITVNNRLGKCQMVEALPNQLFIANLFGQLDYGRLKCYTDYVALGIALRSLRRWYDGFKNDSIPVYLPYGMGAGLAGGDWEIIEGLIQDTMPKNTTLVKFRKD